MSVNLNIDLAYDQVFELVLQLSPGERKRLVREIQVETSRPPQQDQEYSSERFYQLLLRAPVLSEEEIERILEAKKEVDKCTSFGTSPFSTFELDKGRSATDR